MKTPYNDIAGTENRYYVYILLDTRKPGKYTYFDLGISFLYEPFYVGKGTGNRVGRHFKEFYNKSLIKERTVKKIQKITGKDPYYIVYENNIPENASLSLEIEIIKKIGRRDLGLGPLANLTDGGESPANSPECIKRAVEKRKQFYIKNPQVKELLSKRLTERWLNVEYREKLRQKHIESHKNNPNRRFETSKKVAKYYADNPEEAIKRCQRVSGFKNPNCKISKNRLLAILKLLSSGWLPMHVEKLFGLARGKVNNIKMGLNWPNLKTEYPELFDKMKIFEGLGYSLNPKQIRLILRLRSEKLSALQISKMTGFKPAAVNRAVHHPEQSVFLTKLIENKFV